MAIPEKQLDNWSYQGAVAGSRDTYGTIRTTLNHSDSPYYLKDFEIFLQGSYVNDTNIFSESDVDVVIQLKSIFQKDITLLSESEKHEFHSAFSNATYGFPEFKKDVLTHLVNRYGQEVKSGNKAITIPSTICRRKADIIVAIEYRRYLMFTSPKRQSYIEGIHFYDNNGEVIINYPKVHSANLTNKHRETDQWLKPIVRIFKNLRRRLQDKGKLSPGDAPSYYLEGLLYNVPSELFRTNYATCVSNALNWLQAANKPILKCANEQYPLVGLGSHTSWEFHKCNKFLAAAIDAWNSW